MTHWLIVKSEYKHELSVARQIEALGMTVWRPLVSYIGVTRRATGHGTIRIKAKSVNPGTMFVLTEPHRADEIISVRGSPKITRVGPYGPPYCVPEGKMVAFILRIDAINSDVKFQYDRRMMKKRPKRRQTIKLGDEKAMADLKKELFGLEVPEMQEAA